MKTAELKGKTTDELQGALVSLKKEAMNLRFQKVTGGLEKTNRVRQVRREIATILTLLNQQKKKTGENNA